MTSNVSHALLITTVILTGLYGFSVLELLPR